MALLRPPTEDRFAGRGHLIQAADRRCERRVAQRLRVGFGKLRKLEEQNFALLIVDARMPHMDGPRFIRTVRANPATAGIMIFGMTAATELEDLRALEEAGADRLIKKPFRMPNLRQAIRDALGSAEG